MTIKHLGGVFGRNPTFYNVTIEGQLIFEGAIDVNSDLTVDGTVTADGLDVSTATGSATPTATEAKISSSTSASDWSTTSAWGVLGFYSADTSGGGAGNRAQISTNMEVATGAYSSLDFTLANPGNSYAQDSWLKLQNSASSASRKVIVSADGGLDVTGTVVSDGLTMGVDDKIQFGTSDLTGLYRTNSGNDLTLQHWGNASILIDSDNNDVGTRSFLIGSNSQDRSTATSIAKFEDGGDISFYNSAGTSQSLFWDASAESLGIGTTSPDRLLHLNTGTTGAITPLLRLEGQFTSNTGNEGTAIEFITGSGGTEVGARIIATREAAGARGALRFCTGRENDAGFDDGNVVIDESGHLIAPYGVTLGTAVGTYAAANTLDDYEEGTFIPTVAGDATGVLGTAEGVYTKIGRLVFVEIYFTVSTNFTSNSIGGLPFTVANLVAGTSFGQSSVVLTNAADTVTGAAQETTTNVTFYNDHNVLSTHSPSTTNSAYRLGLCYQAD